MELFVLRHSEWAQLYNCTGIVDQLVQVYPWEKRTYPRLACLLLTLCTLYTSLYIPCMFSIWKRMDMVCYKFMFFLGIVDLGLMGIIGFLQGILSLMGAFYCDYPILIYIAGSFLLFFWFAEGTLDATLAFNRCLDMIAPKLAQTLFTGNRVWCWIGVSLAYGFYGFAFTDSPLFMPMYFTWFIYPYTGLVRNDTELYANQSNYVEDIFTAIVCTSLYGGFVIALIIKTQKNRVMMTDSAPIDRLQKMIFLQVAIISGLNTITGLMYIYMQNFYGSYSDDMFPIGHFVWLHIHGLPPVIYLVLNKSIRTDCKGYVREAMRGLATHLIQWLSGWAQPAGGVAPTQVQQSTSNHNPRTSVVVRTNRVTNNVRQAWSIDQQHI